MAPSSEALLPTAWRRPVSHPRLPAGEVHVWAARLEPNAAPERRAVLRAVLGGYAEFNAGRLELRSAQGGKLELVQPPDATPLEFNCSSSGELAVYAVARRRRVGVDVERARAVHDPLELARSVLAGHDLPTLAEIPEKRRHTAFLERWTQTEAYLKARGVGLTELGEAPPSGETWSLRPLRLGSDYVGAVAAEGVGWRLRCWLV